MNLPPQDARPNRLVRRVQAFEADVRVPVAIVGGGACGLTAALMLHDAGVECVVLERDASPGGSTALSAGLIPAAGTRAQRDIGVLDDDPQRFARDLMAKTRNTAALDMVQAYTRAIAPAIGMLERRHALRFDVIAEFLLPGHSRLRMHYTGERDGAALMAALLGAADAAGIPVITQALVEMLHVDDADKVLGVSYRRPDGQQERLGCDALILACNGFGGNRDMVRELLPEMADATFGGHAGNDGSAITWGRALGARTRDLGAYQGHGSWIVPHGALMSWSGMSEGGIQVNTDGRRFHDESRGYSEAAVEVMAQPGHVAWCVLDRPLLEMVRTFPEFCDAERHGAVHRMDTVEALAAHIGCPTDALARTLATMAQTTPQPDGRRFRRALAPAYYAIKVTGALFHTQGGLDVDARMRVLRADGAPFPNLLAAGGAAAGVSGQSCWGYVAGNGLLSAIAGGYLAALAAAELAEAGRLATP